MRQCGNPDALDFEPVSEVVPGRKFSSVLALLELSEVLARVLCLCC